jgi:hypothetical protein
MVFQRRNASSRHSSIEPGSPFFWEMKRTVRSSRPFTAASHPAPSSDVSKSPDGKDSSLPRLTSRTAASGQGTPVNEPEAASDVNVDEL